MTTAAFAILAAAVVAALANWHARHQGIRKLETATKPLATALIIALATVLHTSHPDARRLVVAGLVLCLIGDVLLMPVIDNFVGGLGAFLVGHLLFGVAALLRSPHLWRWMWAGLAAIAVAAVIWMFGRRIVEAARSKDPKLGIAVTAYLGIISLMALVVTLDGSPIAIVGAAFFVFSDTLLGHDTFVRPVRAAKVGIMATYHVALMGLTLGLVWR
jgi:alkenylglycerophosphocholine hydrolase